MPHRLALTARRLAINEKLECWRNAGEACQQQTCAVSRNIADHAVDYRAPVVEHDLAGAKGAKRILAINNDPEAPILAVADYAVIGDLHEVVPAISAELRKAQG